MSDEFFDDEQELMEQAARAPKKDSGSKKSKAAKKSGDVKKYQVKKPQSKKPQSKKDPLSAAQSAPPFWMVIAIAAIALALGMVIGFLIGTSTSLASLAASNQTAASNSAELPEGHPNLNVDENGNASVSSSSDSSAAGVSGMSFSSMEDVDAAYTVAVQQLKSTYDSDQSNMNALLNLANAYFDWGSAAMHYASTTSDNTHVSDLFAQAIELYDAYLQSNPQASAVIVDRAISVFYTGDHAQAIELLEEFTTNNDSFAPAWANLGMFYEAEGKTDAARKAYTRALETAGDDESSTKTFAQQHLDNLS